MSRSFVGDLPVFPRQSTPESGGGSAGMTKNKSAPSLSKLQRQKVESGLYLHPTQIPRSLSATFINYQPDAALSVLYNLPMYEYGGGTKSMLQAALHQVDDALAKLPVDAEDDLDMHSSMALHNSQSQAIPTAPDAIPPTSSIERDLSHDHHSDDDDDHMVSVHIDDHKNGSMRRVSSYQQRAAAESVKHDIEQALKQG